MKEENVMESTQKRAQEIVQKALRNQQIAAEREANEAVERHQTHQKCFCEFCVDQVAA